MKAPLVLFTVLCGSAVLLQTQSPGVPAYHDAAPAKGTVLPAVLTEKELAAQGMTEPAQIAAYKAAARIPAVLYQLPCYCYCDRYHGHKSLHTCFESTHGAVCGTCIGEAIYAYQMTRKGWTVAMIRDSIIRGDWKTIDLQHPPVIN